MYYASIGMLSIVVLTIINFETLKNRKNTKIANRRYRQFLFGVMVYFLTDILWGFFYGERWVVPTYVDTVIYFFSMVVSVLLWTRFVVAYLEDQKEFSRILVGAGWIITLYEIIVLVINFFVPIVFGFDADKEYVPGRARYITLFIQMILFLTTSIYTLIIAAKSKESAKLHHRTIGFSGIAMTIFIALQSLYPLLPFYAVGCLLATCMIHTFVYRDETIEYYREIGTARQLAYKDPLTGVKNKLAYLEKLKEMEIGMEGGALKEYGVVVFDLNGLKKINDTLGHEAGDQYIKDASKYICQTFKHSPVYRIGGDEFVAILEGEDYAVRGEILKLFEEEIEKNQREGRVVISSGLSIYNTEEDGNYNDVFTRADRKMYERKGYLKGLLDVQVV
ncbi:MAG: diguanylate cyclase [Lachnospiraceae bacterium]|nr:diguanylate cyclase [Lachnospiraceae bacterium]